MIRPSKHSNPDKTVIAVSVLILAELRKKRILDYQKLLVTVRKAVLGGDNLFIPALNLLFLLGRIDYHPKTDSVEYIELR